MFETSLSLEQKNDKNDCLILLPETEKAVRKEVQGCGSESKTSDFTGHRLYHSSSIRDFHCTDHA